MGQTAPTRKAQLRRHFLSRRRDLAADARQRQSFDVCHRVLATDAYRSCRTVVAYEPIGAEVDPAGVVAAARSSRRHLYLPSSADGALEFVSPETGRSLAGNGTEVLILVPGVAFDPSGTRLGRGGGWYDRVLPRFTAARHAGIGFEEQLTEGLPRDAWDVPMHLIVTEARVVTPEAPTATSQEPIP